MNYQQKYFKPYYQLAKTLPLEQDKRFNHSNRLQHSFYKPYHMKTQIQNEDHHNTNKIKYQRSVYEPVWQALYKQGDLIQKRKTQNSLKKECKIDIECTFQPLINKNRRYLIANNSTFFQRNQVWYDNKIEKVVKQKQQQVSKNLKDCTFQPDLNERSKKIIEKNQENGKKKDPTYKRQKSSINIKNSNITSKNNKYNKINNQNNKDSQNLKKNTIQIGKIKQIIRSELKRMQF